MQEREEFLLRTKSMLGEYLALIVKKQSAIKQRDLESLNAISLQEEKLLGNLAINQELKSVLEGINDTGNDKLLSLKKDVKKLLLNIRNENGKLTYLILSARKLIHEVITTVAGSNKKALIDRKM